MLQLCSESLGQTSLGRADGRWKRSPPKMEDKKKKADLPSHPPAFSRASLALQEAISTPWSVLLPYFWLPLTDLGACQTGWWPTAHCTVTFAICKQKGLYFSWGQGELRMCGKEKWNAVEEKTPLRSLQGAGVIHLPLLVVSGHLCPQLPSCLWRRKKHSTHISLF